MDAAQARDQDGDQAALPCEQAEADLRKHARGALASREVQLLREHLVRCESCAAAYRATVEERARLGRTLRCAPAAAPALPRLPVAPSAPYRSRFRSERDPLPAAEEGAARAARRWRRFRLRTLLVPLFFAWLILQVTGVGAKPARIEVLEARGEVSVAERPYAEYERPPLLMRGAWCHTSDRSSATLVAPGARLELGPWSSVQAEDLELVRVRLRAGELQVEGSATVVTWIGVMDFESAEGHVRLLPQGLELACRTGRVSYVGPLGTRHLEAGERVELRRP